MKGWIRIGVVLGLALLAGGLLTVDFASAQGRDVQVMARFTGMGGDTQVGLSIRDVEAADVTRESLESANGVVVESVTAGGPADEATVRVGDIILAFDGERVRGARQLTRIVQETPPGRTVTLTVRRTGQQHELNITPEARSLSAGQWFSPDRLERLGENLGRRFESFRLPGIDGFPMRRPRLGIGAQTLTPQLAEYFGVAEGVLVTRVDDDSAVAAAGLQAGDVITAVGEDDLSNVGELWRRLEQRDADETFALVVIRDGKSLTVTVTLTEPEKSPPHRAMRQPLL